jgi:hypothetical protein
MITTAISSWEQAECNDMMTIFTLYWTSTISLII